MSKILIVDFSFTFGESCMAIALLFLPIGGKTVSRRNQREFECQVNQNWGETGKMSSVLLSDLMYNIQHCKQSAQDTYWNLFWHFMIRAGTMCVLCMCACVHVCTYTLCVCVCVCVCVHICFLKWGKEIMCMCACTHVCTYSVCVYLLLKRR